MALVEVETNAYGISTLLGGAPLPGALVARAAQQAGAKAAPWARAYADEILALVEAGAQPELGGQLGMRAATACFLVILDHGGVIEPRWYRFLPVYPTDQARAVLEKMALAQREAALWARLDEPAPPHDPVAKLASALIDLAPSRRICDALVARLRRARPPGTPAMLAQVAAARSSS